LEKIRIALTIFYLLKGMYSTFFLSGVVNGSVNELNWIKVKRVKPVLEQGEREEGVEGV